jgi:hypothetical protein
MQARAVVTAIARTAGALIAVAGLTLGAAACGGSSGSRVAQLGTATTTGQHSPGAGASVSSRSALAYSACMRSHGVSKYPDPTSGGELPKVGLQQLGVSSSRFGSAQAACRSFYPAGGSLQQQEAQCGRNDDCSPALAQQWMNADRRLARCMRSHGIPNFPDPTGGGASGPYFPISKAGISDAASHAPEFMATLSECGRLVGDNAPESFG